MTVIGALWSFRNRGEMSPHKRVPRERWTSKHKPTFPGTNLLDERIGDLPLIAEVVASQLAKITCPTGRQYIENRFQRQSASPGPCAGCGGTLIVRLMSNCS